MNSGNVYIIVDGRLAKVPTEYAKRIEKKETLVARASQLQKLIMDAGLEVNDRIASSTAVAQLDQIVKQIIRLNAQIPPCVQFV